MGPIVKRILVADDNESVRDLAEVSLSVLGDYDVVTVTDGKAAQKVLQEEPVDVLITDLDMPLMTGEELLRWVRSQPQLSRLPVVVLTAATEARRRDDLLAAGADGYMVKPFQPDELEAAVRKATGE